MTRANKCRHLGKSEEAYSIPVGGGPTVPATVWLCEYVENEPGRFVDSPRWLLKLIGNCSIIPERDCAGCPAYSERGEG